MKAEMVKTFRGYEIRVNKDGRWVYVKGYYNGEYTFARDYTYSKKFSKATAEKHLQRLEGRTQ